MKVSQLKEKFGFSLLTDEKFSDREIDGCYVGDLLSWVMGKAQADNVWLTIMNNINIVAVASLVDVACIVLCEDVKIDETVLQKANSQNIIIFSSKLTAYEIAVKLGGEI